ncbi:Signal transduction histidine kinase [Paractinoplanes atraurantiacus]|uniref:histidine kinase n=1 Tax=Paractinoplanes atraurantiacus TaxID=1036182 RepID=A0A285I878_9ACTN|nr:Signal transduction histidine kinase [Actinoplanes atraurantiacus]
MRRWRSSPSFQDRVTAASTFAGGLGLNLVGLTDVWIDPGIDRLDGTPAWWHTVPLVVGCAAMLVKRRHPLPALAVGVVATLADLALGGSIAMVLVLFDLIFSVGQFASASARRAVTTGVFVVIGTAGVVGGLAAGEFRMAVFIALQLTTLLFVPLWWSANVRQQRRLGELAAQEAVLAERAAMARDLHDVIAAHLSTTALHSGAALAAPPDTARDRAALQAVRTSSLAALEEMRSMIMLLRDTHPTDATVPGGFDRLPALVEAAEADGLRVTATLPEITGVPVIVAHTVYRIVHEALTNAKKHAPSSEVRLDVHRTHTEVTVTVTNTLTQPPPLTHEALSAGTGLPSMRERAALLGGSVEAGPQAASWRVHASIPVTAGG